MFRQLSRHGNKAPDHLKHIVVSEENLMRIIKHAHSLNPISDKQFERLIAAADRT